MIESIQQNNGFNVTCSITNVFPITFPTLTSNEGNGTARVNRNITNRDGTFNTSVTHWFPANEKNTTIECQYSYMNFTIMSSLHIDGSNTINQPEEENRMEKNMTGKLTNIYVKLYINIQGQREKEKTIY